MECTHIKLVGGHVRARENRNIGELGVGLKEAGSKGKRRRQRIGLHPRFITVSFIQRIKRRINSNRWNKTGDTQSRE